MTEIEAKVAALISGNQLAFNVGSDNGVGEGDSVLIRRLVEVRDPDTKELIGSVLVPKLSLTVVHVQPKMCVADVADNVDDGIYGSLIMSPWAARKKVSLSLGDASSNVVVVKIGEKATVTIKPKSNEVSAEK
jgi:hypothetical protein